jgi:hypothetical protein
MSEQVKGNTTESDSNHEKTFERHRDDSLNKVLFSSPMHFAGLFDTENFLVTHAFPGTENSALWNQQQARNSASRYYYIMMFRAEPYEEFEKTRLVKDYSYLAKSIIAVMSVYFGKQFDFHGIIEHAGMFNVPTMYNAIPITDVNLGAFDNHPRTNVSIDLNFTKCRPIFSIFQDTRPIDEHLFRVFVAAARLYLRALQSYHQDIENAYLDLVVCGEMISGSIKKYTEAELYDKELSDITGAMASSGLSEKHISIIKNRIHQVKKTFKAGIKRLLNDSFFEKSDAPYPHYSLKSEQLDQALSATYDLRSDHTHNGIYFAPYARPLERSDLCMSSLSDKKLDNKYCHKALSFSGLERMIRFCLLRMLQNGGLELHEDLEASQPEKTIELASQHREEHGEPACGPGESVGQTGKLDA